MPISYLRPGSGRKVSYYAAKKNIKRRLVVAKNYALNSPIAKKAKLDKGWNKKKVIITLIKLGLIAIVLFAIYVFIITRQLPNPNQLITREIAQSTKIYDRTGNNLLYEISGDERRTLVPLSDIPDYVKQATIAIEDKNFYKHKGVSVWAMIRTAITDVIYRRSAGGSTLTQQFVKNAILTSEKTLTRKIKEIVLATRLEQKFTKDQILQMYLNEIPYGSTAYGVESASQRYFKKDVKNIDLAEAAILAALPQSPTVYSPFGSHKNLLIARQHYILDLMAAQGYITKDDAEAAKKEELKFAPDTERITAPHFVMYVKELLTELSISDISQLEDAVKNDKLVGLKGFSDTLIKSIPDQINQIRKNKNYILINKALECADSIISKISALDSVVKIEITGELRRGMEVFSSLPFIALVKKEKLFLKELTADFNITQKENSVIITGFCEIPVIINYFDNEMAYIKGLLITTGNEGFIKKLFGKKELSGKNENEMFSNAKVPFVIPEMREDEFLSVKTKKLKANSDLDLKEFKGLLHWHTTWSDGRDTLESMLNEAVRLNFRYIAVCDHSKSAAYANGLKEERVLLQKEQLGKIQKQYKIKLFQGIESDILADGSLDYPQEFLPNFDFVVASVHSRFNIEKKEMTARIIKAVENPYTDLLGHPSGLRVPETEGQSRNE